MEEVFGEKIATLQYRYRKAVYAVIILEGKLLTVINHRGHYFLPGGGLNKGETNLQCLEREMMEETGYRLEKAEYIGSASLYFLSPCDGPIHNDGSFYYVSLAEQKEQPLEQDYTIEWCDIAVCENCLLHAHHVWAVRKVCKEMQ